MVPFVPIAKGKGKDEKAEVEFLTILFSRASNPNGRSVRVS
jgi:hypothetical protein